jgi:hypothetical protein
VHSYDDPETADLIQWAARDLGAPVQYESYFPMAELTYTYTYTYVQPLVRRDQLQLLGTQMRKLHDWYMQSYRESKIVLTLGIKDDHYFRGNEELNIDFAKLFQLFNQDALDGTLMSCYCL